VRPFNTNSSKETDWPGLGEQLYLALGVVAHERGDLNGPAAYGEALRMLVEAGHLVTVVACREAVAEVERVAEGNRELIEIAHRDHLTEVTALRRTVDRQVAERLAGLADEVRAKAGREKLGHHVRRGALLAADWLAAPAAQLAAADERLEAST
jgi:hypothetical protein